MSSVEILNFLKKNIGIIIKRLEETGVLTVPTALDHVFYPEVEVSDIGVTLPVNGFLVSIGVYPNYAPVKVNFDRPVTDFEYTVIFPGIVKVVGRLTGNLYLKAPLGHISKVRVEALRR